MLEEKRSLTLFRIAAQLPAKAIPAAFAEDGPSRESIVRAAIERAKAQYRVRHFERIVSVGDAVWDVRAARQLQLPFVAVGTGQRAVSLRQEGAGTVIGNFLDHERCFECFDQAVIPESRGT